MRQKHSSSGVWSLFKNQTAESGIVIGDFTCRLVARCFAHQKAEAFQEASSTFQFALSTRSGAESVVRLLTAALELDPESTLVSVDGVGAFDTMSRQAMLQGLLRVPGRTSASPLCACFIRSQPNMCGMTQTPWKQCTLKCSPTSCSWPSLTM